MAPERGLSVSKYRYPHKPCYVLWYTQRSFGLLDGTVPASFSDLPSLNYLLVLAMENRSARFFAHGHEGP
jgi:hypothetical protein